MTSNTFPLTLEAVQGSERSQWKIGDALLKECGKPSEHGVNDGSFERLHQAAAFLRENGFDYTRAYLAQLREIAHKFPASSRRKLLAWRAHLDAGDPETLEAIIAGTPKGQRITADYVRSIRERWAAEERARDEQRRKAALEKARKQRDQAEEEERRFREDERKAQNEREREKAQAGKEKAKKEKDAAAQAIRDNRSPPKRSTTKKTKGPPAAADVPIMAIEAGFLADAAQAKVLAERARKAIAKRVSELTPTGVAALTEAALEAANVWKEAADIVRGATGNKRGHLVAV